jgi:hypothetical protein
MDGWRRAEDGAACDADHEPPALLKLPRQAMTYAARDPLWVGMERKEDGQSRIFSRNWSPGTRKRDELKGAIG